MRYSRSSKPAQCAFLKGTAFSSPLIPMTFIPAHVPGPHPRRKTTRPRCCSPRLAFIADSGIPRMGPTPKSVALTEQRIYKHLLAHRSATCCPARGSGILLIQVFLSASEVNDEIYVDDPGDRPVLCSGFPRGEAAHCCSGFNSRRDSHPRGHH